MFVHIKDQVHFKGEIITKKCKNRVGSFKNFLKSHWLRKGQLLDIVQIKVY
jgi:hypothetical protein